MVSFVSRPLYTASNHCMSQGAPCLRTGGAPFRDDMIDAATNVTGHTMTALELFVALIFMFLIVLWIFGRYQREE
jgi:hypothetical protein